MMTTEEEKLSEDLAEQFTQPEDRRGPSPAFLKHLEESSATPAPVISEMPSDDLPSNQRPMTEPERRAAMGLPVGEEVTCGSIGPSGQTCRLAPHTGGLHAAKGETWTDEEATEAAAGKIEAPSELGRIAAALEEGVSTLKLLYKVIESYVDTAQHRQR